MGALGMMSFILEETIQAETFGYITLVRAEQYDDALGVFIEEEPFITAEAQLLRTLSKINLLTGRAFKAFANATLRRMARDKAWIEKMRREQNIMKHQTTHKPP